MDLEGAVDDENYEDDEIEEGQDDNEEEDEEEERDEEDEEEEEEDEGEGEPEEEMEEEAEQRRPPIPIKRIKPVAVSTPASELDSLLLNALKQTTSGKSNELSTLLNRLSNNEQKQLAKSCVSGICAARALMSSTPDAAFDQYMSGLDVLSKFLSKCDAPTVSFEQSIKFVANELRRLSRRTNDVTEASKVLLPAMRQYLTKFKSASCQAVALCLCVRLGSTQMGGMKVLFEARVEKTRSNQVSISYYQGRLKAIEGRIDMAASYFMDAYRNIPWAICQRDPKAFANKRRIFERLVPFNLVSGKFPKKQALDRFSLGLRYDRMIRAAKSGDLRTLNVELRKQESYLSRLECATLLKVGLNSVAKQHIFRIVAKQVGNNIDLKTICMLSCWDTGDTILKRNETDQDKLDRLICIVSDLVSRDLIRGEIDHHLVLHLQQGKMAFPTLSKCEPKSFKASKW